MKSRILKLLFCFTLLSGSLLTSAGNLTDFHNPKESKHQTLIENTSLFTTEVPGQEGDLRVLKITFKNYRSAQTQDKHLVKKIASFYYFDLDQKDLKNYSDDIFSNVLPLSTPIYIRLRKLIV